MNAIRELVLVLAAWLRGEGDLARLIRAWREVASGEVLAADHA